MGLAKPLRICKDCGLEANNELELKQFIKSSRHKNWYRPECKECKRTKNLNHYNNNKIIFANNDMVRRYGISIKEYDTILIKQKGKCAICGTKKLSKGKKRFDIDHCHSTGEVRGLLCWNCNNGLGQFKDSIENLTEAIIYLSGGSKWQI